MAIMKAFVPKALGDALYAKYPNDEPGLKDALRTQVAALLEEPTLLPDALYKFPGRTGDSSRDKVTTLTTSHISDSQAEKRDRLFTLFERNSGNSTDKHVKSTDLVVAAIHLLHPDIELETFGLKKWQLTQGQMEVINTYPEHDKQLQEAQQRQQEQEREIQKARLEARQRTQGKLAKSEEPKESAGEPERNNLAIAIEAVSAQKIQILTWEDFVKETPKQETLWEATNQSIKSNNEEKKRKLLQKPSQERF